MDDLWPLFRLFRVLQYQFVTDSRRGFTCQGRFQLQTLLSLHDPFLQRQRSERGMGLAACQVRQAPAQGAEVEQEPGETSLRSRS